MKLPSTPSASLASYLNQLYFGKTWNSPDDHGRVNFGIDKAAKRVKIGTVTIDRSEVGLPTSGTVYAVYRSPATRFGRFIKLPHRTWVNANDILNDTGVRFDIYSASGHPLPMGAIWLLYNKITDVVVIAVETTSTRKCTGETYPSLYITVNFDTSRASPVEKSYLKVSTTLGSVTTPTIVSQAILEAFDQHPHGTTVLVNGIVYLARVHVPILVHGDVVEITSDPDVVGYTDIDVDSDVTGYYSELYGEYREILHIPKSLNPNNVIITNDTVDFVVYDPSTHRGLYGIRIDEHAIESITHNDFSIPRTLLAALRQSLGSLSVKIRVYVRFPTKPLTLTSDVNNLSDLYGFSDEKIMGHLTASIPEGISEWKAQNLEVSPFLDLLYSANVASAETVVNKFEAAVGFFDIASTIGDARRSYVYGGGPTTVRKPARLYGYRCDVIMYAEGIKIRDDYVAVSDIDSEHFSVSVLEGVTLPTTAKIDLYVFEYGLRTPTTFVPSPSNHTLVMDSDDYTVVKKIQYSSPRNVLKGTATDGFVAIAASSSDYTVTANTDGTYTYLWKGLRTQILTIDDELADSQSLVFDLKKVTSDSNVLIPSMYYNTAEVYINGHRLVENVDYSIVHEYGAQSDILSTLLMISNAEYISLTSSNNIVEVVFHGDTVGSFDSGYVIDNKLTRKSTPAFWEKQCSRIFVDGKLTDGFTEVGNTLESESDLRDGGLFMIEWNMPYSALKLLKSTSSSDDRSLKAKIDILLGLVQQVYPDTTVIDHVYKLYSPFLAQVGYDVMKGNLTIVNEPSTDAFLRQFAKYKILVDNDPVLGASNTAVDRRFVDINAHYTNISTEDPTDMLSIQRLDSLVLTPSAISIREVLL